MSRPVCRGPIPMPSPTPIRLRSYLCRGSLAAFRGTDRKAAEIEAQIDALTGSVQRQRDGALGEDLSVRRFAHAGVRLGLGVVSIQLADAVDRGERARAVRDLRLSERQPAALGLQKD